MVVFDEFKCITFGKMIEQQARQTKCS